MFTSYAPFWYVSDTDDPDDGHAFYFQQTYNKLVIVRSDAIDVPAKRLKRESYGTLPGWQVQKQYATPGDKPWFCYWNNTLLEAFIYKSQPAVIAPTPTSSSTGTTITPPPTQSTSDVTSSTTGLSITWAQPWETVTTTIDMTTTSCTYTGAASGFPDWMRKYYPEYEQYQGPPSGPPTSMSRLLVKRDDDDDDYAHAADDDNDGDGEYTYDDGSPVFKYLVKIEERRQPQSPAPMCVQYQVLDDYTWNVVTDEGTGEQVTITLEESVPGDTDYPSTTKMRARERRRNLAGQCHCQWMSGE
jgi:hypothetical protein